MKRSLIYFSLIFILALTFVSAGFFSDLGEKLTGRVIDVNSYCSLDVDENGRVEVATDVVYISRSLLGLSPVPTSFRTGDLSILSDSKISSNVNSVKNNLDVDENGNVDVATDLTYISRTLLGLVSVPENFRTSNVSIISDERIRENVNKLNKSWSEKSCDVEEEDLGGGGSLQCLANSDCNDNNECTFDSCNSGSCLNSIQEAKTCSSLRGVCNGEGTCITQQICIDTDGGQYNGVKGKVAGIYVSGTRFEFEDSCVNESGRSLVREYYCSNNYFYSIKIACPTSTVCQNGSCVNLSQQNPTSNSTVIQGDGTLLVSICNGAACTLYEGSPITSNYSGQEFRFSIDYISSTQVRFYVNGVRTDFIAEGGSYRLENNFLVTVNNIIYGSRDVSSVGRVDIEINSSCVSDGELCDGLDNNCNGQIDEDRICNVGFYCDNDGDNYKSIKVNNISTNPEEFHSFILNPLCSTIPGNDCNDDLSRNGNLYFPNENGCCDSDGTGICSDVCKDLDGDEYVTSEIYRSYSENYSLFDEFYCKFARRIKEGDCNNFDPNINPEITYSCTFEPYGNFYGEDIEVLKLFGQRNVGELTQGLVSKEKIAHASGVVIDNSNGGRKMYVVDGGNSRILGLSAKGRCSVDSSKICEDNEDCTTSSALGTCNFDNMGYNGFEGVSLIIGQKNEFSGACNQDANLGIYKNPTKETLCFFNSPDATNFAESWSRINIDVDNEGNLYVPDVYNNRILKYNQPFSKDKTKGKGDNLADFVIGQKDFNSNQFNKEDGAASSSSLRISYGSGGITSRGVSVDNKGNVWVADTFNHRVLRFPKNSKVADLVIGQNGNFTSRESGCSLSPSERSFTKLCNPTLAKIHPKTGLLYILDEGGKGEPFVTRIVVLNLLNKGDANGDRVVDVSDLVYLGNYIRYLSGENPNFSPLPTNEQINSLDLNLDGIINSLDVEILRDILYNSPSTSSFYSIVPRVNSTLQDSDWEWFFQSTGFEFNPFEGRAGHPYGKGVLWVNEHSANRNLLIDNNGTVIETIGAFNESYRGCSWVGGSIGFDKGNNLNKVNIYLADEGRGTINSYSLPYNFNRTNNSCLQGLSASFFNTNKADPAKFDGGVGIEIFNDQLIVGDDARIMVWNDYIYRDVGSKADIVVGQDSLFEKKDNNHAIGTRIQFTKDDKNRLWAINAHGKLIVYQLPLRDYQEPIANFIPLYWSDNLSQEVDYGSYEKGLAFDNRSKLLFVADGSRVLAVNISRFPESNLSVSFVIGQKNKQNKCCNQAPPINGSCCSQVDNVTGLCCDGKLDEEKKNCVSTYILPKSDTLCVPTVMNFDKSGNLYVAESNYEGHGNLRMTVFSSQSIRAVRSLFPNLNAVKVFGSSNFTSRGTTDYSDPNYFSPVGIAFDKENKMVIGVDGYRRQNDSRITRPFSQLLYYNDPLKKDTNGNYIQGQNPDAYINLPMGSSGILRFDEDNNLIIRDHTWPRIWVINLEKDLEWLKFV